MLIRDHKKEAEERRTFRRVGCRFQVMNDALGVVSDISEGGARFSFHHAVSLQEDLDIPIKIADRIIWARVHPLWAQPASTPQSFDLGGSFTSISDEDRQAIHDYVEKSLHKSMGSMFHFPGHKAS